CLLLSIVFLVLILSCCGARPHLLPFPTRRSSDLPGRARRALRLRVAAPAARPHPACRPGGAARGPPAGGRAAPLAGGLGPAGLRSEEHTSELQSRENIVCRLLLEKKKRPESAYLV